jgi:glutamate-1-semialdehyde 2,1-aminomutase
MAVMNIVAIVQARMGSSRFPGKVAKPLGTTTVLGMCLKRLKLSEVIDNIVVATTLDPLDQKVIEIATSEEVGYFIGDSQDVLRRFYDCAVDFNGDLILRITADCPFIDPTLIDEALVFFQENNLDYFCNQSPLQYPDGLDFDIFTFDLLKKTFLEANTKYDREHVTPFMKQVPNLRSLPIQIEADYSKLRWTVDEPEDLIVLNRVLEEINFASNFGWREILNLNLTESAIFQPNSHIVNNEGSTMSTGEKLWKRALRIIPGGNDFFTKRPSLFLTQGWPTYYQRAKGCHIWDLDGNKYLDMSIMGIGTNSLGYGNETIDEAVIEAVRNSNMSTFNAPEQVYLAEKLIEMHPWFDMAKFARTGGEINAVAIRIARSYAGKDKVVVCGYHGWHDWYLSTNLANKENLNEHLLPGLKVSGVPLPLSGLTLPIRYNNFDDLRVLEQDKDIGVLIMEVMRSENPKLGYLERIREICDRKKIVLIFDECTSGFRETFGGLHIKFGVNPDLATFGKALGNGYPITALLGKKSIMEHANESFISSTFWSDRIGFVAGLKTLEVMEATKSWELISDIGSEMQTVWKEVFSKFPIDFKVTGIPALSAFVIQGEFGLAIKTHITREFLSLNTLASNIFYPCTVHSRKNVLDYRTDLEAVLSKIDFENLQALKSSQSAPGFARLN